nr:lysine histidine transporter-like 8 [Ipomoea batatas]
MPTLDNWERLYVNKKKMMRCPTRWVRIGLKVLAGFVGSITMPLTLTYPCFMWIAMKIPRPYNLVWCVNMGLGWLGMLMCTVLATATLWSLIVNGLHANFFDP